MAKRPERPKEYDAWANMLARCRNPKRADYVRYGGRGVQVCERWRIYENFFADMGPRPSPHHSVDRIDNNGNYCPENCRWATRQAQGGNKRNSHLIEFDGFTAHASQWSRATGVHIQTIFKRLREGWPVERALFAGDQRTNHHQPIGPDGRFIPREKV